MAEGKAYLCDNCPGKGDSTIDFDTQEALPYATADSFRQTRGYAITDVDSYGSDEELAESSSRFLRYYDSEEDEYYEKEGDVRAALLGIACAKTFLAGECAKTRSEILLESEID